MVSVHIPKTGGTSFKRVLESVYGSGLAPDYPGKQPREWMRGAAIPAGIDLREAVDGIGCIHGHFNASKYRPLKKVGKLTYVTWLRDPVERVLSAYYFLRNEREQPNMPDWQRKAHELDVDAYFRTTQYGRSIFSSYLGDVDLDAFAFIGITERFDDSMAMFRSMFAPNLQLDDAPHERQNPSRKRGEKYDIPADLRRFLTEVNAADIEIYERGVRLFERRLSRRK